jgi:S-adenosylmethionine:tRNA ribosyltransferase-isomerase
MNRIEDFDYHLPPELVAQYPPAARDSSRLLVLRRETGELRHAAFKDLARWLDPRDLLVVNDTRVFPARLHGRKESGGRVELLLHHLPEAERPEDLGEGARGSHRRGRLCHRPLPPLPNPLPQPPYGGLAGEFEGRAGSIGQSATPGEQKYPNLPGPLTAHCSLLTAYSQSARGRATYRGRLRAGQVLYFGDLLTAEIISLVAPGVAEVLFFSADGDVTETLLRLGEVPLPPYIHRSPESADRERYQTVYAARPGAVAAPTAGLHFTAEVLADLARRGIDTAALTLHVGPGTFLPVRQPDYTRHRMHPEYFELSPETAARLNQARRDGKRLTAVGTTSVRVLEHCAGAGGFAPQKGWCDLFIYPGYRFRAVDRMLTNFHLPKSTLLLLVSAFAGRDLVLRAYEEAVKEKYRFYSYGDCMLIL